MEDLIDYLNDGSRFERQQTELIIDIDSTHFDTFGKQENTDHNAQMETLGTVLLSHMTVSMGIS